MTNRIALTCFFALILSASVLAQDEEPTTRRVTMTLVSNPVGVTEKTNSQQNQKPFAPNAIDRPPVQLTVASITPSSFRAAKRRHIEYSEDQLIIVGLSADSTELTRTVITDPRLIRAEALRGENDLASKKLFRPLVNFSIPIDDPLVVSIRILQPVWDGSDWSFVVIAETQLK